jgi:hypothetical protein
MPRKPDKAPVPIEKMNFRDIRMEREGWAQTKCESIPPEHQSICQ